MRLNRYILSMFAICLMASMVVRMKLSERLRQTAVEPLDFNYHFFDKSTVQVKTAADHDQIVSSPLSQIIVIIKINQLKEKCACSSKPDAAIYHVDEQ